MSTRGSLGTLCRDFNAITVNNTFLNYIKEGIFIL